MTTTCRAAFHGYGDADNGYGWYYCTAPADHVGADKGYGHESKGKVTERPVVTMGDEYRPQVRTDDGQATSIQLDIWRTVVVDGKPTGLCNREKGRPVDDIHRELVTQLQSEDLIDESFSMICDWLQRDHESRPGMTIAPAHRFSKDEKWTIRWGAPGTGGDWGPRAIVEQFDTEEQANAQRDRILKMYAMVPCALDTEGKGDKAKLLWPEDYRWIACYAVTGGSEGHYVHIDLITDIQHTAIGTVRTTRSMFLAKTFRGMDHAVKLAARCAVLLGA